MEKEQAEALAKAIEEQVQDWLDEDAYDAYLRRKVFGGFTQQVQVVAAAFPDTGFSVLAHWELLDEEFASLEEWEVFKQDIENGLLAVALGPGDEQEEEGGHS